MSAGATYPVRVEARLDPGLSRWLWLVKWFLAIPHYFVLAVLWIAFGLLSVAAFFAILFTGRYPHSIFEFNVGVLRWSWRVAYYAYGALGTDRYPPFTLAEVPDYPAHLEIAYPERLSRGLVLVKWWLLAIPHYLVVGILLGGTWVAWQSGGAEISGPSFIGLLVLIAAIALAITGRYPQGLFDLILGFNRWILRVAAYASLMTDAYPPFRLDMGGSEPTGTLTVPPPPRAPSAPAGGTSHGSTGRWTTGPIVAVAVGALATLMALGLLVGGGAVLWADRTQRDGAGFLSTEAQRFDTSTHALVADRIDVRAEGPEWIYPSSLLDEARVRVTPDDESATLFVGLARSSDVDRYLDGVAYAAIDDVADPGLIVREGEAPATVPSEQSFWTASVEGSGTQTLKWPVAEGSWTLVAMNADASGGLEVRADIGAKLPVIGWIAAGLLAFGGVLLLLGAGLIAGAVYRASRSSNRPPALEGGMQ